MPILQIIGRIAAGILGALVFWWVAKQASRSAAMVNRATRPRNQGRW